MATDDIDLLRQTLTGNGYKQTAARVATFEILKDKGLQTMPEVLAKSRGRIDRVSVYRNIELFEKLGIVHRIYAGWKYKLELSDQFVAHHHHLTCMNCGKVVDIPDEKHITNYISGIANKYGFTSSRHQFEIEGYCSKCSKTKLQQAT